MIEANNDLSKQNSWLVSLKSVLGSVTPHVGSCLLHVGRTVEIAAVRCSRDLCSVVPACPTGMATNSTLTQYFLRATTRGEYFSLFFASLVSHQRFL